MLGRLAAVSRVFTEADRLSEQRKAAALSAAQIIAGIDRAQQQMQMAQDQERRAAELHPIKIDRAQQQMQMAQTQERRAEELHPVKMESKRARKQIARDQERRAAELHPVKMESERARKQIAQFELDFIPEKHAMARQTHAERYKQLQFGSRERKSKIKAAEAAAANDAALARYYKTRLQEAMSPEHFAQIQEITDPAVLRGMLDDKVKRSERFVQEQRRIIQDTDKALIDFRFNQRYMNEDEIATFNQYIESGDVDSARYLIKRGERHFKERSKRNQALASYSAARESLGLPPVPPEITQNISPEELNSKALEIAEEARRRDFNIEIQAEVEPIVRAAFSALDQRISGDRSYDLKLMFNGYAYDRIKEAPGKDKSKADITRDLIRMGREMATQLDVAYHSGVMFHGKFSLENLFEASKKPAGAYEYINNIVGDLLRQDPANSVSIMSRSYNDSFARFRNAIEEVEMISGSIIEEVDNTQGIQNIVDEIEAFVDGNQDAPWWSLANVMETRRIVAHIGLPPTAQNIDNVRRLKGALEEASKQRDILQSYSDIMYHPKNHLRSRSIGIDEKLINRAMSIMGSATRMAGGWGANLFGLMSDVFVDAAGDTMSRFYSPEVRRQQVDRQRESAFSRADREMARPVVPMPESGAYSRGSVR